MFTNLSDHKTAAIKKRQLAAKLADQSRLLPTYLGQEYVGRVPVSGGLEQQPHSQYGRYLYVVWHVQFGGGGR